MAILLKRRNNRQPDIIHFATGRAIYKSGKGDTPTRYIETFAQNTAPTMRCHSDDSLSSSAASTTEWLSNLDKNESDNHLLSLAKALASREQDLDNLRSENRKLHNTCEALRNENRALLAAFVTGSHGNEMKTLGDGEKAPLPADEQSHAANTMNQKQRQQDVIHFKHSSIGEIMQQGDHRLVVTCVASDNKERLVAHNDDVLVPLKNLDESIVDSICRKVEESIEKEVRPSIEDVATMLSSFELLKTELVKELKNVSVATDASVTMGKEKSQALEATMKAINSELESKVSDVKTCVQTSPSSIKDTSSCLDEILIVDKQMDEYSSILQSGTPAFSKAVPNELRHDFLGIKQKVGDVSAVTDAMHQQKEIQTCATVKPPKQIAAGYSHTLALEDEKVKARGRNDCGQVSIPADLGEVKSIAAGSDFSMALKKDGTVVIWGNEKNNVIQYAPRGLSQVEAIAAGDDHALALMENKTVVAWGSNEYGQIDIPAELASNKVKAIAAGLDHSLAFLSSGKVISWGHNEQGQTNVPADLENVKSIAVGYEHTIALKNDGTVVGWGSGEGSKVPLWLTQVKAIASGSCHSLALLENGEVKAWGDNEYGQISVPSNLGNVVAIASGWHHSFAMKADGSIVGWGWNGPD